MKAFRVDQTRQALTVFLRGIENRHWESHGGRWRARFRVKAPVESAPCAVATTPSRGGRFEGCGDDWDEKMRREMRVRHYSIRTEQTYLQWVRRFRQFTATVSPGELGEVEVRRFLEDLAIRRQVSASTQNQAFSALLFFFEQILGRSLGEMSDTVRAKRGRRLPVVLSQDEVKRLITAAEGTPGLMLRLLYGTGMRLMECLRLRVKDVDYARGQIHIRAAKGNKDRIVMAPVALRDDFERHFGRLRQLFESDRRLQIAGVWLPDALSVKFPRAGEEWGWQ